VLEAARGAEVLVHEATFLDEDRERAGETGHSTALEAAELARDAEVGLLALTHLSNRYFGPEAAFSGSWTYDQIRVGAHITGFSFMGIQSGASVGFVRDSGYGRGFYAGLNFQANF